MSAYFSISPCDQSAVFFDGVRVCVCVCNVCVITVRFSLELRFFLKIDQTVVVYLFIQPKQFLIHFEQCLKCYLFNFYHFGGEQIKSKNADRADWLPVDEFRCFKESVFWCLFTHNQEISTWFVRIKISRTRSESQIAVSDSYTIPEIQNVNRLIV